MNRYTATICQFLAGCMAFLGFPSVLSAQTAIVESGKITTSDFGEQWCEIVFPKDGRHMMLVPAGTYHIGIDDPVARGFSSSEGPMVSVTVGSFYIDKYEVSTKTYLEVATKLGLGIPRIANPENAAEHDKPVSGISHEDALQFAEYLKKDLPTEAEWEIAARGAEAYLYPWGNTSDNSRANLGNSGKDSPHSVGTKTQDVSPFGVVDMAGNISEWCRDYYFRDYYQMVDGETNPRLTKDGESCAVRGGNYFIKNDGHVTLRTPQIPTSTSEEVGFRTVYRLVKPPKPTPTPTPIPPTPTPTPSAETRIDHFQRLLEPYFANPMRDLPNDIMGYPSQLARVPFVNQTPFDLNVAFIDIEETKVYQFPTSIERGTCALVEVPNAMPLYILASAKTDPPSMVVNMGPINSESSPIVLIQPNTFNEVVMADHEILKPGPRVSAIQYYPGSFQPLWNLFEVYNDTNHPVEITVGIPVRGREGVVTGAVKRTVEPGQSARFSEFGGTPLQITGKYLGATENITSRRMTFKNDETADHRIFRMVEEPDGTLYQVLSHKLPVIAIEKIDVRLPEKVRDTFVPKTSKK